ncbi:structural maintenance of chromosomes protein 4 [Ischnura elegans]|uniref:structural maintenance of chromosomes protein 4 n=1 Tax=Ischnura elegans TaxID=197161 RepID=UPI001ED8869D|nr:structural maintenance of chromosomes protein 4 [Ischnura elegans]
MTSGGSAERAKKRRCDAGAVEPVDVEMEESVDDQSTNEDVREGGMQLGDVYIPPPPIAACSSEAKGVRLMITKIVNENFKSYAGVQVLGPFHKCFTAIVGPNGSGKSNVIDSLLFVFGYRAAKIRSKKVSVLIHKSPLHQDLNRCTVAVHFQQIIDQPGEGYDVVENSQFCVSRTAFKDNSSFYQINGRRVQFKEVGTLLRSHGIDLDYNRFLILQGEVEQIAMMKAKGLSEHEPGMLEFLEDIIGTSRFKAPLEKLSVLVEELSEQRAEKFTRVRMVEKEKDSLIEPVKGVIGYLKDENRITHLKNILYQKEIFDKKEDFKKKEEEKNEVDASIKTSKAKLKELSAAKDEKVKVLKENSKNLEGMTAEKEELTKKFKLLDNEDVKLQEHLKQKNAKRKANQQALKTEKEKLEALEKVPAENEKDIVELTAKEAQLMKEKAVHEQGLQTAMAGLQAETQGLQDEREPLQTKLMELRKTVDEAKSKMDIAQSELDIYLRNEQKEMALMEQIKKKSETTKKNLAEKRAKEKELKTEIPRMEELMKNIDAELESIQREEGPTMTELQAARQNAEEKRSAMSSNVSRGRVLDALLAEKRAGRLPGIFGRLGDLGAIDAKYDVAISTACGPLDHVVVDTVDTAKQCIEFLKVNNIGRVNIIVLEKMEKWRQNCEVPLQRPDKIPRLFDLIKISDQRLATAFYFGLRETLVAPTVEIATKIGLGAVRHRVVTLKGELIEPSGTMSGGGKRTLRGRMGQSLSRSSMDSVDPNEMQRLEEKVTELTQKISQLRSRQIALTDQKQGLVKSLRDAKTRINTISIEIQSLVEMDALNKIQLKDQEEALRKATPVASTVKALTDALEKRKKVYKKESDIAEEVQTKVEALSNKIKEITGSRTKAAQKKLEDCVKRIEKITAEIRRLKVAIKTAERNAKKSSDNIQRLEREIHDAENEMKEMQAERTKVEEMAADVMRRIEDLANKIEGESEGTCGLKREVDEITKEENQLKSALLKIEQKYESIQDGVKECKSKIALTQKKLNELTLQDVPDVGSMQDQEAEENEDEIGRELKQLTVEELGAEGRDGINIQNLQYRIQVLEEKINSQEKPNLSLVAEYKAKQDLYLQRTLELEEITKKRNAQRQFYDDARRKRQQEFHAGFSTITFKLKEVYQMITLGGDAELELVDSLDPFSEGVNFSVRPPKKSWKNISNLSGGEKTLSSLALVFALHYYKPAPLYVMDEIDAALDFKNVSIIGNYIKERTRNTQFIIISLRSNMFELSDRLVGIYKTNNCTQSVAVNPAAMEKYAETQNPPPIVNPPPTPLPNRLPALCTVPENSPEK